MHGDVKKYLLLSINAKEPIHEWDYADPLEWYCPVNEKSCVIMLDRILFGKKYVWRSERRAC